VSPKGQTLNAYLAKTLGVRRALTCETFMMVWGWFEIAEGREPANIEELAEAMGRSPKTLYRWQQDFRRAFPGESTPSRLMGPARAVLQEKLTVKRLGAVELRSLEVT
jgi:hypothetical protein